ncbi:MAG: adenylate/guanylate cyclase domain-containing protein [Akkermansiaceae bacterium]|nr:adenylate/guanylate cyclase domain-containing protein [Akkermansiaceae bacterium]
MIRGTERGTRLAVAVVGAVLAVLVGVVALLRLGWPLVSLSYDLPFLVHRGGTPGNLCIVYMDQADGESLARAPHADLLDRLGEGGARAAVYDLLFDRPSPKEPGEDPEAELAAVDAAFAAAIRRFRGVGPGGEALPGAAERSVILAAGRKSFERLGVAGEQLIMPIDPLLEAADFNFGLVAYEDEKFTARRITTGTPDEPSLSWKAAQLVNPALDEGRRLEDRWVNFAGPPPNPADTGIVPPIPSVRASNVISGGFNPEFFRGKIVVIGGEPGIVGEALGKDLFATPFHRAFAGGRLPLMSGVELQANMIANLAQENWLTRSGRNFDLLLVIVAGLGLGVAFALLRPLRAGIVSLVVVVVMICAGVLAVRFAGTWFPWSVVAFAQVPAALVWGSGAHFYVERFFRIKLSEEQKAIREAFARYLSPQMLDQLTEKGFEMKLGGERLRAGLVFTDLENFTAMCERVDDPEWVVNTLNGYFERTTEQIFKHDGVIMDFVGDAIFAAWGVPVADPEAPRKAIRAAWDLLQSAKLNIRGEELRTRVGVHFAEVVAGNVGSHRHVDYALVGDGVNLASRLEGLNKLLGTSILLSEEARQELDGEFAVRRVGRFRVKGRKEATGIYELVGPSRDGDPPWAGAYHEALEALEGNDPDRAAELFRAVDASRREGDGPSRFILDAIDRGEDLRDGVVSLTVK